MGRLSLGELYDLMRANDTAAIKHRLEQANARVAEEFKIWTQAEVAASIDYVGGAVVRIHVSNPAGGYSTLEERSDGLKWFIALVALTAKATRQYLRSS